MVAVVVALGASAAGMKGVLVKPLQLDLLKEELSRVLSASSRAA